MRLLRAALGYGLTFALSYCWTRAVISIELLQGEQSASSVGLMVLLAVAPLTGFFLIFYTLTLPRTSGRFMASWLAFSQAAGTLWGWAVVRGVADGAGGPFLLSGAIAAAVGGVVQTILTLRQGPVPASP